MESNEIGRGSPFYNAVIKELSLIVETENIVDQINPILSLEIKLYYIKKNGNYTMAEKDDIMKRIIIEKTRSLEHTISGLVKEYADAYQRFYQKEPELHYTYIKILKKVKLVAQELYGQKLNYVKTFYFRYLEWMMWNENLQDLRSQAVKKIRSGYHKNG
ncbi:hypothetical protein [Spiroplasma sp. DGKH1]|uniref:hypothetical protein n=1 Tax=Spiroplasma sp. DGKH1 TaxID=3050074 RepID=UPI0034C5D3D6